ncbi:MAG: hypothetical protein GY801_47245 [bacterium]|nr:hypothetical protein [bacterium]
MRTLLSQTGLAPIRDVCSASVWYFLANDTPDITIYSIVTTGDFWQFGKLTQSVFTKHPVPVSLHPAGKLLGILNAIFSLCEDELHTYIERG